MDNALLSFFQQDKDLLTDNRPLRLRLAHHTQMLEDVLLPQCINGSESICGVVEYRIFCVSLDAYIPLKELIALPVAVDLVTDRGNLRSVCGIVTEVRAGDSDGGLASYQLVLRDALSIMEKRTNTRVFRNKNELEIVQLILDEWIQTNPIIGTCFRYELDAVLANANFSQREFTMQYNESDAAFIRRMLKRRGVAWFFRPDQEQHPSHTMVLFNDPGGLRPSTAGTIRYHRDAATEDRDTITSWCASRTLQPSKVTRFSWDFKQPDNADFLTSTANSNIRQGKTADELSATLDDYQVLPPHACNDHEDLCQLGQLAINHHDLESKCFHGAGSVRDLCVGEYFTLEGHPEIDGHSGRDCDFVVTSLQLAVSNNLPQELTERMRRLLSRNRWMQTADLPGLDHAQYGTRVAVSFDAIRRDIPIVPLYDARTDLPNIPIQSAVVVGPPGEEVHCDKLGRVKIRFRMARSADHRHAQGAGASESDVDSAWVRVASNWAGNGPGPQLQCGYLGLPRIGSEVLVAFLGADPDKPVIVGQLFNQRGQPPAMSRDGSLPINRYLSGIRSREIFGIRGNQLRFDDTSNEISAQLASEHGGSQLNLGFLTSDRANGSAYPRGEGTELRSELAVSIRGEAGILIAANRFNDPKREILDRDQLQAVATLAKNVSSHLSSIADTHSDDHNDNASLNSLTDKLESWDRKGGEPIVAISAAAGIIAGSSDAIALAAQTDLFANSVGNTSIGAGGGLFARAAKGISMLASKIGMKLIAASGDVKIESHDGSIVIASSKAIKLIANDGIELHSPKIKMVSQGTQIDCGGGKIIQQSNGPHTIKSSKFEHLNGGDGNPEKMQVPSTEAEHDQQVVVTDLRSDTPIAGRRYRIELEAGKIIEGITDANGLTERFSTKTAFEKYSIELLD
ncbi:type VI secretion system Vgr family protein [Pseudoduganella sp. S-14]|uniref:type VI secretion system Vgr family protein n=1 Tax=Pseudoduganella sp. S-14 TaxID=3404065 RepID=UPI003CEAD9C8